jgi:hypothetical protein
MRKTNAYVRRTCAVFIKQFPLSWSAGHRHWKLPLDPLEAHLSLLDETKPGGNETEVNYMHMLSRSAGIEIHVV